MAFVIYNKQTEVFRVPILNRFLKRVAVLVKESYPAETSKLNDSELDERLKEDYDIAKSLGVTTQRAVMRFICLGFGLGRKFYEQLDFKELFSVEWADKNKCIDLVFDYDRMIAGSEEFFIRSGDKWDRVSLREGLSNLNFPYSPFSTELWKVLFLIGAISSKVFN